MILLRRQILICFNTQAQTSYEKESLRPYISLHVWPSHSLSQTFWACLLEISNLIISSARPGLHHPITKLLHLVVPSPDGLAISQNSVLQVILLGLASTLMRMCCAWLGTGILLFLFLSHLPPIFFFSINCEVFLLIVSFPFNCCPSSTRTQIPHPLTSCVQCFNMFLIGMF